MSSEARDVLDKDGRGSALCENAHDLGPEPAVVAGSFTLAGDGPGLAGKARSDEIHDAAPRSAVEGCSVIPDKSRIQGRTFHPRHEKGRGVGFPLNVTNGDGRGKGEADSEAEPSDS